MTPKTLTTAAYAIFLAEFLFPLGIVISSIFPSSRQTQDDFFSAAIRDKTSSSKDHRLQHHSLELKSSCCTLAHTSLSYKIPDLRALVLYHGTNQRPDAPRETSKVLFSLRGNPAVYTATPKEQKFLTYDTKSVPHKWSLLPEGSPLTSALSIRFAPTEGSTHVQIALQPPSWHRASVDAPHELREYTVQLSPPPVSHKNEAKNWYLDQHLVDPSLLERQGAEWYGKDMLLAELGDDDDWSYQKGRERVQFGHGEAAHILWVQPKDTFVFENGVWKAQLPGPETMGKALLVAEEVQEGACRFTIWNEDGSQQSTLQLSKKQMQPAAEGSKPIDIKIVGARSRNKWIAEINGCRIVVTANDWILLPEGSQEAITLSSPDLLQAYLEGKINGSLIIFQGTVKVGTDQCLTGLFFPPTRAMSEKIQVSLYRSWEKKSASSAQENAPPSTRQARFEDEDDDDLDDALFDDDNDDEDFDESFEDDDA